MSSVVVFLNHLADFIDKLSCVLEITIYAGKTNIRHLIDVSKMLYDAFADKGACYLLVEIFEYVLLDPVCNLANLLGGDRSFVTGLLQAGYDFFPVVRDAGVVFFYDEHFEAFAGLFVGSKAFSARQALASSPDYPSLVAGARIEDFITVNFTERTSHAYSPPRF
jgi:hypothetical protein